MRISPLMGGRFPVKIKPMVTAGLKSPPLILYSVQAVTRRLMPYASEMKMIVSLLGVPSGPLLPAWLAAMEWARKAKSRNKNVPTSSPDAATKCLVISDWSACIFVVMKPPMGLSKPWSPLAMVWRFSRVEGLFEYDSTTDGRKM